MTRMSTTRAKTQCSKCDSFKVARIIYGMPDFTDRLEKLEERGKIIFGGCCVNGHDSKYQCTECGAEYFKRPTGKDPDWTGRIEVIHTTNPISVTINRT